MKFSQGVCQIDSFDLHTNRAQAEEGIIDESKFATRRQRKRFSKMIEANARFASAPFQRQYVYGLTELRINLRTKREREKG